MLGKTHRIGGISFATITSVALYTKGFPLIINNPEVIPVIIAGGWVGGLMPDIDHPNSTISNFRVLGLRVFKPLSWLINLIMGHRGATHTIWGLFLTWLPFMIIPLTISEPYGYFNALLTMFGLGYAVGYFSHLLLDSFTPSGTPMLWPLPDVHLGKLTTGKYDRLVQVFLFVMTPMISFGIFHFF